MTDFKVLIVTTIFPNQLEPVKAMHNKQDVFHLAELCDVEVIALVPWVPPVRFLRDRYFHWKIPEEEEIDGIRVHHPRYLVIPKLGRALYGFLMFFSVIRCILAIHGQFEFDIIYAPWVYPDGFAAMLASRLFRKPVMLKALGSDIHEYTRYFMRRKLISYALNRSNKVIAVSNSLKQRMAEIGVSEAKIKVIPNGIDGGLFNPMDRVRARSRLGLPLDKSIVLFVGNLVTVKGLDYLIDACSLIREQKGSDWLFIIIGDGPLREGLKRKVTGLNLGDSIIFAGQKPHEEIPYWMNACDLVCLPSLNEGLPNVILETLACGTPVVATCVGGVPEIIKSENIGILAPSADAFQLAQGILKASDIDWDRSALTEYAHRRSWHSVARETLSEIQRALDLRSTCKLDKKDREESQ